MKCTKKIIITAYKVQYVDLREEKPRTPREEIYTIDKDWADAMGLLHLDITDAIRTRYERAGYKAFSIEKITPKCEVTLDLNQLYYIEQLDDGLPEPINLADLARELGEGEKLE